MSIQNTIGRLGYNLDQTNESQESSPDSKVHGANMGPTWALLALDGPHVGSMNLAIRVMQWTWCYVWTLACQEDDGQVMMDLWASYDGPMIL